MSIMKSLQGRRVHPAHVINAEQRQQTAAELPTLIRPSPPT